MAEPHTTPMSAATPPPPPANDPLFGNPVSDLLFGALEAESAGASGSSQHTEWAPPSVEHVAALLPAYAVKALVGRGGMGAVYEGVQLSLNRPVAIKLLPAELAGNTEFVSRFQREAHTLARLQHPGIVAVHDFGRTTEGHLYFIMEFVAGTDLQHIIHGPGLEPAQALELTLQICEALQYAHTQGVIHRDIKPANVLITQDGRAKLADFGLARPLTAANGMTAASLVMGTPEYMAPEQWAGKVDHRADIYALGVMLYEMLTGTRPHGAFDLPSVKARVDQRLDGVVIKAMRQAPEQRYQNVSELRDEVNRIRTEASPRTSVKAAPEPRVERRRASADTWGWAAAVVVLLLALAAGAWLLRPLTPQADQPTQGEATPAETKKPPTVAVVPLPPATSNPPAPPTTPPAMLPPTTPVLTPPPPQVTPTAPPAVAANPPAQAPTPEPSTVPTVPPPVIEVFSREAQNLLSWAVAPLEEAIPSDVRRNLTFIREDLIDEGKARPAASLDAYREAFYLCEALLSALDQRDEARVGAGYRNAQAAANQPTSNQALDARRNYLMSWPQYSREESQLAGLRGQHEALTIVAGEAVKFAWAAQASRMRTTLDTRYRAFRAALRK